MTTFKLATQPGEKALITVEFAEKVWAFGATDLRLEMDLYVQPGEDCGFYKECDRIVSATGSIFFVGTEVLNGKMRLPNGEEVDAERIFQWAPK